MFWLLVSVLLILIVLILLERHSQIEGYERIPGPKGIYLLGNAHQFLLNTGITNVLRWFDYFDFHTKKTDWFIIVKLFYYFRFLNTKYKRLYKINLAWKRFAVVYNPEDIEAIISRSKNTRKGYLIRLLTPWLQEGLLLSDGEKWYHRRKILTSAFHFNILQNYMKVFEEESKKLVERLSLEVDEPKTHIYNYIADCTLSTICETAMGMKLDTETSEFGRRYKDGIHTLGQLFAYRAQRVWLHPDLIFSMSSIQRKQNDILELLSSFRDKVINERRQEGPRVLTNTPENDDSIVFKKKRLAMLDLLLQAEKEGVIDAEGIKEEVDTFMFEGHDTTATCLQFAFMLLANNPQAQDKVFQELTQIFGSSDRTATMQDLGQMKYLECCIKEVLRLYPPVLFIMREIDQDLHLRDGYMLPAGTDCAVLIGELHRRPDQFVEALEFRPERFMTEPTWHPYAYIPFSAGPRNCIGQRFAMIELKMILSSVLRRFRLQPVTTALDLIFYVDIILRVKNPIYVKIVHRE